LSETNSKEEEEGLTLELASFFRPALLSSYAVIHRYSFLTSLT
jgi:hypothetical protein